MTADKVAGWLQLAGGLAMILLQVIQTIHGTSMDPTHVVSGTALAAGGVGTIVQGSKLSK